MLPNLSHQQTLDSVYHTFLQQLPAAGFTGDIETAYGARLSVATDNSIYQAVPQAVVLPKGTGDLLALTRLANRDEFKGITFSPRGGGTGTNGQSLNDGIIVDMSRHMNQVLEINEQEGWVRVQTGVVKDQLNQFLKPYGYFFSPDLSTSNRATIGGMINTDASGQGSLVYGKTSDHVLALTSVLMNGEKLETDSLAADALLALEEPTEAGERLGQQVARLCRDKRALILDKFPRLNRFLTGYDLEHVFSDDLQQFNLSRLLTGSEGSLAFICEAKLNITPIPTYRTLINIIYDSFDSALRDAPSLVAANATSVETIDSRVLNLAREDIVWQSVSDLIPERQDEVTDGLNMLEYANNDSDEQQQRIDALCERLDQAVANREGGVLGYQICSDLDEINRIYAMRKKAVGLLGAAKGFQKPIAFAEDTAVPPEQLADFIAEFRELLDGYELDYGMFGHVDAGVLHVRPALDMCDPAQEVLMKEISDQVVALTAKYGGLMWGEHGKGYRSEYSPAFFGDELFADLRRIKGWFDPDNRLNPGKICTPLDSEAELVKVTDAKRGGYDRQIPLAVRESFGPAMSCNGNGLCFNFDTTSPMCPSSKITRDRRHSPKGRAGLVREWLRLLAEQGVDATSLEQNGCAHSLVDRIKYSWGKHQGEYDYSHEVKEAMDGCLACKACSSQCPIKVDVPGFRSRFLNIYHQRYLRPASDYLVANVEQSSQWMARAPKLANLLMTNPLSSLVLDKAIGMVDSPALSVPALSNRGLEKQGVLGFNLEWLKAVSPAERHKYVLVVQDPFTSYYDADVVEALLLLIVKLGYHPVLLPFKPNGKPAHVKGFLKQFAKTAGDAAAFFNQLAALEYAMVGIDPSLVLCYRDEYKAVLGDKRGDFEVRLLQEWLTPQLASLPPVTRETAPVYKLFAHCSEKTAVPTSHQDWQQIFAHFGAELQPMSVGCCGMAGTYGHERKHLDDSKGIYALSWQQPVAGCDKAEVLATGYSCRSQVARMEQFKPAHPVQALLNLVGQ